MAFIDQQDFNRTSRNVTDSGIKMFFSLFNNLVGFVINFIKEAVSSILGK